LDVNKATTPLMQQYLRLKEKHPGEVLFFRLGDFYEMFFEDAVKASPILEVVLTKRQSTPMCGVPYHAVTGYISKLLKAGLSVAIAEQLEDPAKTKGMVKRDVVRVITPGTIVEDELLPSKANNFLVAIAAFGNAKKNEGHWTLCAADISTGKQWIGELETDFQWNVLKGQLAALNPSEILLVGESSQVLQSVINPNVSHRIEPVPPGAEAFSARAVQAVKLFLENHHSAALSGLSAPQALPLEAAGFMFLDQTAIRHLELVESSDPAGGDLTLLSVIDETITPLGSRLLRWILLHPSTNVSVINSRLDNVESFFEEGQVREEIRLALKEIPDIERIIVRAEAGSVTPRELAALRSSFKKIPEIKALLERLDGAPALTLPRKAGEEKVWGDLNVPPELKDILNKQLSDEPPSKVADGGVIREGFNGELDELRGLRRSGKKWIAEMESAERANTGITNLKVGYNDIYGYFLEVSKSHLGKVPADWIRKQTLTNGERFITPALKEQEEKILGAESRILALETELFGKLVKRVAGFASDIAKTADALAQIDVFSALAEAAELLGYTRPELNESNLLEIKGGRHPVVENQIRRDRFIPNDLRLGEEKFIAIITGPNMAGKSTYLRQNALIVILAQMGSFVPAEKAVIGIVDRIFTRIGASDRLAQGQSTFMVEMQEVATLILNSTPRSLLILDEVGRGTSTYDGMSIAWSVIEHLSGRRGQVLTLDMNVQCQDLTPSSSFSPRTLFATHFFELTQLADDLPGVMNAHATAKEWLGPDGKKQVVFLYQILPGPADRSYGIHVGEMAGLPSEVVDRAREILAQMEGGSHKFSRRSKGSEVSPQLDLFSSHQVLEELKNLDVDALTPREALNKLAELKEKIRRT